MILTPKRHLGYAGYRPSQVATTYCKFCRLMVYITTMYDFLSNKRAKVI
jgi:hypothetical protein